MILRFASLRTTWSIVILRLQSKDLFYNCLRYLNLPDFGIKKAGFKIPDR